jgi:murein DD-endopeptidase MepM/ murein hydrolase activator NlpD
VATSLHANPPEAPGKAKKQFIQFKSKETLYGLLRRHGFNEKQIVQITRQNLLPKGLSLAHGEAYRVRQTVDRKYAEIKIYEAPRDLAIIFWRHGEASGGLIRSEKFKVKERAVSGRVQGSILGSIMARLPNEWVAHRFMDAYTFDFNLVKQLKRNAHFSFRVETKWDGPDLIGYGEILETSLEIAGNIEHRHFVRYPGGGAFVSATNHHHGRPLFAPVSYVRVSSLYDARRLHPIKRRKQPHKGVDFELPEGTDIFSAEAGTVLRSGRQRASGNFVVIRHHNGLETYYNHMHSIADNIFPGAKVTNGQKIGTIGCTGYCTKAHLHFAVKRLGGFVDPMNYLKSYPFKSQALISKD